MSVLIADVDGAQVRWSVEGATLRGPDSVMLDDDVDLTAGTSMSEDGYGVFDLLSSSEAVTMRDGITALVSDRLRSLGFATPGDFALDQYHHVVVTDADHALYAGTERGFFPLEAFPVDRHDLLGRISELLGRVVDFIPAPGRPPSFLVRVVRPGATNDANPPHRDVWLPHLRHTIAAYVPVAASTAEASLPVLPGSHRWPESDFVRTDRSTTVDGATYGVPSIASCEHPLRLVRPNPSVRQILLFSPYLVHGGAKNGNVDATRVSLELRFRADPS